MHIVDKRTVKKFERMGFESDEINKALEITHAIMTGASKGDPKLIEIYLKLTGEDKQEPTERPNNLLDAILAATREELNTDDLPEFLETTAPDADVVEQA